MAANKGLVTMSARTMEDIAVLFRGLRFKKKIFGGVDEKDVWRQLDMIQKEYRSAYEMQQERYEARLQERDEELNSLKGMPSSGTDDE